LNGEIFLMSDGMIVKTHRAKNGWLGRTNPASCKIYTLYVTRRGSYYLVHRWKSGLKKNFARWMDRADAAQWLLDNGFELPEDLNGLGVE